MRKEEFYAEAIPDSIGPLEGIRVLEATHYGAGPLVGTLLADLGAEDIKCDLPGEGDILRQMGPYLEEEGGGLREGITHLSISRNKKCITLNFRAPEGQEIFREMAKRVDVVVENFKPGTMEKWGLSYQDIRKVKPDIIYTSATGYGQFGPYAYRPGYDTVGLAYGGMMHITGFPDGPPVRPPNAISDNITGWLGAYATLAAILYRNRTGKGQHIDIGQVDVILYTSLGGILGAARDVFQWERVGNGSPATAACNLYSCKDGYVYIIAISPTHWARLCRIMDREDLITDLRTNSLESRGKNREFVDAVVADWVKEKSVAEVVGTLDEAQLVVMPILNFNQIIQNEHIRERDMVTEVEHPAFGKLPIYGVGPKFSLTPARVRSAAPLMGQHNPEIYEGWLGLSPERMAELKEKGVI